jgi:hypothetical protein
LKRRVSDGFKWLWLKLSDALMVSYRQQSIFSFFCGRYASMTFRKFRD